MTTFDTMTTAPSRSSPWRAGVLRHLESDGPDEGQVHFALIRGGLETLRRVPGEAIDGEVTLRTSAPHPEVSTHLSLTEHHGAKQGSVDRSVKELALSLVATRIWGDETAACASYHDGAARLEEAAATSVGIVSGRGGGGRESNPPEAQRASRRC